MTIEENLRTVRQRIERAGGNPSEIKIVAVTKGFGPEICRQAIATGLKTLGENRVQEALQKMDAVDGAEWHLLGHLQTNKVRHAAGRFTLIQSVDSSRIAEAIAAIDAAQPVLVEVNVARETQKMAMGPTKGDPTPAFAELRTLRDQAQQRLGKALPILSMGMSGDFEAAVKAGSTMLRLGEALFGPRPA